ncbi:unnamed protein product [Sphacelaria rigidula]
MPGNAALATEPSIEEVKEAPGKLTSGKAVGTDNLCGELLKLSLTEDSATLKCLHNLCERKRTLPDSQRGSGPRRSKVDMMCVIRRLQNLATENNILLYMFFIDLRKMCESVDHTFLWRCSHDTASLSG